MYSDRSRTKGGWKRGVLIFLVVVLSLILVTGVALTVLVEYQLSRINRPENQLTYSPEEISSILAENQGTDAPSGPDVDPSEPAWPEETAPVIEAGDQVVTILLVGQDSRTGHRAHSDSMILCTINKAHKTLTMTSFMRDMYLHIPGFGKERINVAYMVGGFPMLNGTLLENFGVQVDYNIEVNFSAFQKIVDLVGGVDLALTAKEAQHMMEASKGTWALQEGMNHLDGEQALSYARIRKIDSDFNRTGRQRTVLHALLEQIRHADINELYSLVDTLIPYVTTDMTSAQILNLTLELAPLLPELKVENQRIPVDGGWSFATINGNEVILVDFKKNQQLLQQTLGK